MPAGIEISKLTKRYGPHRGSEHVSLRVEANQVFAVSGSARSARRDIPA